MIATIPWTEHAVFVHHVAAASRRISGEGTLRQMVNRLAALPIAEWRAYTIFLPDRRIAPFDYGADDFSGLIAALAPGSRAG
jgi:hypothetical protein